MMNVVALGLMVSSLVTGVVWSPAPDHPSKAAFSREGHRVVVVEFEREGFLDAPNPRKTADEKSTAHAASEALHHLREVPGQVVHVAKAGADKAKDALKAAAGSASDAAAAVLHGTGYVAGNIKEKAADADRLMKDQVKHVAEKTGEIYESAKAKAAETTDSVKDAGAGIRDKYREAVSHIPNLGQGLASTDAEQHGKASSSLKEEGSLGAVKSRVTNAQGKIQDRAADARETYESVKESIGRAANEYIKRPVEEALGRRGKDRELDEYAERMQQAVKSAGDLAVEKFRQAVKSAGDLAVEKFRQAVDEAYRMSPEAAKMAEIGRFAEENGATARNGTSKGSWKGGSIGAMPMLKRFVGGEALKSMMRLIHLFAFATVYGISVWFTFLAGHVLAGTLSRQQFGLLQSKMYTVYFKIASCGLGICLVTHAMMRPRHSSPKFYRCQSYNLLVSLMFTLLNMLYLKPRATKVLFEMLRMEKEEGRGADVGERDDHLHLREATNRLGEAVKCMMAAVNKRLKVMQGYSSIANMLVLLTLSWHLVYLSLNIHV